MKRILLLKELNEWYDTLEEPKRFLFFLVIVAFPCCMAFSKDPEWNWVQIAYMLFVAWWAVTRMFSKLEN